MFVISSCRLRRDVRGQSLAEFAIAVPILMLLLFGVVEFSRHFYARLSIRQAVAEAARFASTGQTPTDEEGEPLDRAAYLVDIIHTRAAELGLIVPEGGIRIRTLGDGEPVPGAGEPGQVVQIQADFTFEFDAAPIIRALESPFTEFTVVTTYKNEPRF